MRVHEPLSVLDLLDVGRASTRGRCRGPGRRCRRSERGVAVLLNCGEDADALLRAVLRAQPRRAQRARGRMDLRTYGIGAQILRDLGVRRMRLLGSPRRMPSMTGYGLEVTGFVDRTSD